MTLYCPALRDAFKKNFDPKWKNIFNPAYIKIINYHGRNSNHSHHVVLDSVNTSRTIARIHKDTVITLDDVESELSKYLDEEVQVAYSIRNITRADTNFSEFDYSLCEDLAV